MTLKQLQYIVMIVETGNITEAAREVQIAAFSTASWRSKWWYRVRVLYVCHPSATGILFFCCGVLRQMVVYIKN